MANDIPVFHERQLVGMIIITTEGPRFAYDPTWRRAPHAFPVSLRMPLDEAEAPPEIVTPWLANLLPEGAALSTTGRWLGVDPHDVVALVARIGRDTAGALSFGHPRQGEAPRYIPVPGEGELERIIEELPARPFLVGEDGVSMSLAGAQEKLPIALGERGGFAIPVNGAPSTYILKPDNRHLFGSVQNEALCLVLARRVGLRVATVTTGKAGRRSYLLVTRYDRAKAADGSWVRLHQEDFCQALGRPPAAKYQFNQTGVRGPSLAEMFALCRRHAPGPSVLRLLDAVILNVLIANVDAHAKNYALMLRARGAAELAPLYDLMCGAAWDRVTPNMAQEIGGQRRGAHVQARHWRRLAAEAGLNPTALLRRVRRLADIVEATVNAAMAEVEAMPAGGHVMLGTFAAEIRKRCATVRANLTDTGDGAPEGAGQPADAGKTLSEIAAAADNDRRSK